MTFLSLQLRSTKIIGWFYPGGKVCVTGCHVTSRNEGRLSVQRRREAEKRDPGNEGDGLLVDNGRFPFNQIFRFEIPGIPFDGWNRIFRFVGLTRFMSMVINCKFQVSRENTKSNGGLFYLCLLSFWLLDRRRWSWNKRCIRWGWQYNFYRKNLKGVCDYI